MRNRILLAVLLIASLFCVGLSFQTQPRTQFEFKLEYGATEKKLNEMSAQGWDLVAVGSGGTTVNVPVFVFKRPK